MRLEHAHPEPGISALSFVVALLLMVALGGCGGGGESSLGPPSLTSAGIRVEVVGWGNARDADGFALTVGTAATGVSWNGSATLVGGLPDQPVTVTLGGIAPHCSADSTSRIAISPDTLRFAVGCFGDLAYTEALPNGDWRLRYLDTLGNVIPLAEAPGRQIHDEWSPTGEHLVYRTNERGDLVPGNIAGWDLAVVSQRTGVRTWVATSPAGDLWPSWSPDGKEILYHRWYVSGPRLDSSLAYRADSSGLLQHRLLGGPAQDWNPAWVDGGSSIAFGCQRFFPLGGICRTTSTGTGLVSLTPGMTGAQHVSSAPLGEWIVFMAFEGTQAMWVVPATGGTPIQLAPGVRTFAARWAPDGIRLAVNTLEGPNNFGIRVVDRSSGSVSSNLTGFSMNSGLASWSPDGNWLVVSSVDSTGQHLHVLRPDGSGHRAITPGPGVQFNPWWRPSTRFVAPPAWVTFEPPAPIGGTPSNASAGSGTPGAGTACFGIVETQVGVVPCRVRSFGVVY